MSIIVVVVVFFFLPICLNWPLSILSIFSGVSNPRSLCDSTTKALVLNVS